MRNRLFLGIAGLAMTGSLACAAAQAVDGQLRLTSTEIGQLPQIQPGPGTSGLRTIKSSVVYGDPERSGPYTIVLDVPPDTKIKAHTHKDMRTVVVVRGTWYFGYGSGANDAAFKTLDPGSFYSEPPGLAHFAKTGPDGARVYISGWGPTDTHYVE